MFARSGETTPPCGVPASGWLSVVPLHHAGGEPLVDRPTQHAIAHPLVENLAKSGMRNRVEEALDVHFQDPASSHDHQPLSEIRQRLMRRAVRSVTVRAG